MMSEAVSLAFAVFAGGLLGSLFYVGLWFTVRRLAASKCAGSWLVASLVVRTGIVLTGFYAVGDGDWRRLLSCLVGFLVARPLVTRWVRAGEAMRDRAGREAGHAS